MKYQHDKVQMFFKNRCVFVIWTKVTFNSIGRVNLMDVFVGRQFIFYSDNNHK